MASRRVEEPRALSFDDADSDEEYRRRLQAQAPYPALEPRSTLGFSHIYVLSLPGASSHASERG